MPLYRGATVAYSEPLIDMQAFLVSIGWTTKPAQNVMIARVYSRPGEGNIIVAFAVCDVTIDGRLDTYTDNHPP